MNKKYVTPAMEITVFETDDVITESIQTKGTMDFPEIPITD